MTAALPSLALALLCLLQAGAQVPVQPNLDTEKFAGVWHVTAIASNCSIFLKMKDGMKSSMAIISFMPEGDLALKLVWPLMDKCQKFELLLQQSGQAGHYMGAQEKRDLHVMETDYSHYAVLHEAHHSEAEPSTALQLLTREQDVSPQLLQKFMQLISTMGLTKDMLAILPKSDQCIGDIRAKAASGPPSAYLAQSPSVPRQGAALSADPACPSIGEESEHAPRVTLCQGRAGFGQDPSSCPGARFSRPEERVTGDLGTSPTVPQGFVHPGLTPALRIHPLAQSNPKTFSWGSARL
ncbi:lipocalin-15-like [Cinclus cinclus]|uniref:lipocalin-15-like n=1 Tax=Cinclus cinclus TaxID=127875 RepID=UPI002E167002